MNAMKRALLVVVLVFLGATVGPAQEKMELVPVKYEGLKQEIQKHRGKVVVVDFWATTCPPCMKAFPDFIAMQKQYADRGMVLITVSFDDPKEDESVKLATKFINRHPAPVRHFLLDEPAELKEKKFAYVGLPFYYVFDRQGRWVRFRGADSKDGVDYAHLRKVVEKMLDEK